MSTEYFYLDIDLKSKKILKIGIAKTASLSRDTKEIGIHKAYLIKGQYNKLVKKLER